MVMCSRSLPADGLNVSEGAPRQLRIVAVGRRAGHIERAVFLELLGERVLLDLGRNTRTHGDGHQASAVVEGVAVNLLYAGGNVEQVEAAASVEGIALDGLNVVGDDDACQVVLLLCMTYLTFVFDVPYYYVKGENFLFPISFIYHNADSNLKRPI